MVIQTHSRFCYGILSAALVAAAAGTRADELSPTTRPVVEQAARDKRPRLAVVGFTADPNGDPRDAWIPVALEELTARRLQRVPGVLIVPTIRLHQGRRELSDMTQTPPWPDVARGLGATHLVTCACRGPDSAVTLSVALRQLDRGDAAGPQAALPAGRLYEALDALTRWVLEQLAVPALSEPLAVQVFAPPSRSVAAVEYFARAVGAARADQLKEALRYASEAVDYDKRFRPALGLLAQLESQMGPAGRGSALRRWLALGDYARFEDDPFDRIRAEVGQCLLLQADGAFEAARTRAETALLVAETQREPYGQIVALTALCDLHLLRPMPVDPEASVEARRQFALESGRKAAAWQELLVRLLEALGDVVGALPATNKLALLYERIERPDDALALHRRTLALAEQLKSQPHEATAWLYVGQWYRQQQRWPEALEALGRCLALADEAAKPAVRMALGAVYHAMEQPEESLGQYELAYEQIRKTEDLQNQLACLREIADARMKLGRRDKAIAALQEAVELAHALELRDEQLLREQLEQWKTGGT